MPNRSHTQPGSHPEFKSPANPPGLAERRQFGRRTTVWHAWIVTSGAHRTACVVRNVSARGALLELDVPAWLPHEFILALEEPLISIACDVRHRGQHGLGISFRNPDDGQRLATLAIGPATQPGGRPDERLARIMQQV